MNIFSKPNLSLLQMVIAAAAVSFSPVSRAENINAFDASAPAAVAQQARIRLFGRNGWIAVLYPGKKCVPASGGIQVSGGAGSAFGSLFGMSKNEPIGMPQSPWTHRLREMDDAGAKAYYREYVIPAESPVTIELGGISKNALDTARCSISVTFQPEPGKDYEAGLMWQGGWCSAQVQELHPKGDDVELLAVTTTKAPDCPASEADRKDLSPSDANRRLAH